MKPDLLTAAKAAGIEYDPELVDVHGVVIEDHTEGAYQSYYWNPYTDDGDSARLRTALEIYVSWSKRGHVYVYVTNDHGIITLDVIEKYTDHFGDKDAALRAATLRLAAEIGRRMP